MGHEIEPLQGRAFDALNFATQRFALISSSGGGKSYGCGRIVEDLFDAQVPVCVVDTVGIWPAIKLAADGKSPGLPFVIVGGEVADVPFVPARAAELARFIVGQNASAVVDVSDLMPDERAEPLAVFFETALIEIKSRKRPRFFVLDEAQDLVPERAGKGEARLVRAVSAFVRKARNHMCGSALLTQRPQDVSKSVLNQVGNLFVGMLFGEHERKAIANWVSSKANSPEAHAQLKRLAELEPGDFYFWSPSWQKLFGKFRFAPKRTFDGSSSTPMDLEAVHGKLAQVDVAALRKLLAPPKPSKSLAAALAEHESNGELAPAHLELLDEVSRLRLTVEEQERELVKQREATNEWAESDERARAELDELRAELRRTLAELQGRCAAAGRRLRTEAEELESLGGYAEAALAVLGKETEFSQTLSNGVGVRVSGLTDSPALRRSVERALVGSAETMIAKPAAKPLDPIRAKAPRSTALETTSLDGYTETLLSAIKAYGPLTRRQLALVTGTSLVSSTFSTSVGKLHADGWITLDGGKLTITADAAVLAPAPWLVRGRAVREYWRSDRLDEYSCKLFDVLIAAPRVGLSRKELANLAVVSQVSSTFSTTIGKWRKAALFAVAGGKVALSAEARWAMLA